MNELRIRRASVADRDHVAGPTRPRPAAIKVVWARRPCVTGSGRRLLAFKIDRDNVAILVAGSPPRWVPAESVLSHEAARRWLAEGFTR